jgi:Rieske Fe-S protein
MTCIVSLKDAEKTWDCPCHGSRYYVEEGVIDSPTVYGLRDKKSWSSDQYFYEPEEQSSISEKKEKSNSSNNSTNR